jgi:3-oxoacyl-[acyl-carrier-protein] synthase-1
MEPKVTHRVKLTPRSLVVDGKCVAEAVAGDSFLTHLYRKYKMDYPKFFKMDVLCKVGFIASEIMLETEGCERFVPRADRAVILFNRHSSLHADNTFQRTIANPDEFYPSPSVFVYTLPNIVTGEIAIRNKYHGESSFILLPEKSETAINQAVARAFMDGETSSVLTGWVEAVSETDFEAEMKIVMKGNAFSGESEIPPPPIVGGGMVQLLQRTARRRGGFVKVMGYRI